MRNRLSSWCLILMALAVSACDQQFKLVGNDGSESKGILAVHAFPPHDIAVSIRGEEFVGQWRSTVVDETETIRRTYGTFSRPYEEYMSGHWTSYLRHGHASLHGPNGTSMECDFNYRGEGNGDGACVDGNGTTYRMML